MDANHLKYLLNAYPCVRLTDAAGGFIDRWITCPVRIAFPSLDKPRTNDQSGKQQYQATLLFPVGADVSVLRDAVREMAAAKFGPAVNPTSLRMPLRSQDDRAEKYAGFEKGGVFLNTSSQYAPVVIGPNGDEIAATDQSQVYAGIWARVKLTCYAYDQSGNRGVSFGIVSLQKVADDTKFATAGGSPTDGFKPLAPMPNGAAGAPKASPSGTPAGW